MEEPRYTCPRCHYHTNKKAHLIQHLNKQKRCSNLYSDDAFEDIISTLHPEKQFKCDRCTKSFSQIQGLSRHKKTHADEPSVAINTDSHDVTNHEHSHNTNITTINDTHDNTNITIESLTIQLLPFGKEDVSSILNDKATLDRYVREGIDRAIPLIVRQIFLNDDLPQNQNVKLAKEHFPAEVRVYKTDIDTGIPSWKLQPRSIVLQDMVDKGATVLQTHNNQVLHASGNDEETMDDYDRRNTKLVNVKAKKKGTGHVKEAVLEEMRIHQGKPVVKKPSRS